MAIHGLAESFYPKTPAHFNIEKVIRPNILALHPYRCARDDYSEGILLDANENALGHSISQTSSSTELDEIEQLDLHRYPSPSHESIKSRIASIRSLPGPEHVFLGVGSDEVIDLLMRICVKPGGEEKILITPPTYGMYAVCAQINDVGVIACNLELESIHGEGGEKGRFSLRVDKV
jgi:histidinol-phosphate aminotransferase